MIDFSLSDEQRRFLDLAREFSAKEIGPVALQYDRDGTYPEPILKKARELGLMYTNIPTEYGGSGMDYVTHYLVTEALNYDCCAIGQMIGLRQRRVRPTLHHGVKSEVKVQSSQMR